MPVSVTVEQVLAPGVEDRKEAQFSAEMFPVAAEGGHGFGRRAEQDGVDSSGRRPRRSVPGA
jgi:hypothetical protein